MQDRSYTVMMIDPDYPHHSNGQFYLHWLVTNIPVNQYPNTCLLYLAIFVTENFPFAKQINNIKKFHDSN